jgi:hypothetical protein
VKPGQFPWGPLRLSRFRLVVVTPMDEKASPLRSLSKEQRRPRVESTRRGAAQPPRPGWVDPHRQSALGPGGDALGEGLRDDGSHRRAPGRAHPHPPQAAYARSSVRRQRGHSPTYSSASPSARRSSARFEATSAGLAPHTAGMGFDISCLG